MLRLEIAALYCGVNILLLLVLGYLVTGARRKHKIRLGDGDNPDFFRRVRAHANAAEYIPAGLVGIVTLSLFEGLPIWVLHGAGISLTAGRLLHAFGLHAGELNFGRVGGMILTFTAYLILGAALIYVGLSHQLGG
ncbi:MAG: MAPEG family protein [Proteobacteria bacterium]|nr:MAPEG family protein [Pseudomonadota bacterium]